VCLLPVRDSPRFSRQRIRGAIAEIGLEEIERELGHYAGLINEQAKS
jgi:hypothetical protein